MWRDSKESSIWHRFGVSRAFNNYRNELCNSVMTKNGIAMDTLLSINFHLVIMRMLILGVNVYLWLKTYMDCFNFTLNVRCVRAFYSLRPTASTRPACVEIFVSKEAVREEPTVPLHTHRMSLRSESRPYTAVPNRNQIRMYYLLLVYLFTGWFTRGPPLCNT